MNKVLLRKFFLLKTNWRVNIPKSTLLSRHTRIYIDDNSRIQLSENIALYCSLYSLGGGKIEIGKNSSLRFNTKVFCASSIKIGNNVIISDNVTITDTNHHPVHPSDRLVMINSGFHSDKWHWKFSEKSAVTIEDNVWIGQGARIIKGVVIGKDSVIASSSVVTKSIPAGSIAVGNPARVVKSVYDSPNFF